MSHWIFGYGSLMWRPDFDHHDKQPATIHGFSRRFWQASPDHRGVPEFPGRVVTLIPDHQGFTQGFVYRVAPNDFSNITEQLDVREQGGYVRLQVEARLTSGETLSALTYYADESNPHYLGAAQMDAMVKQILRASGPSGSNRDYLLRLAEVLRAHDMHDQHVFDLERALRVSDKDQTFTLE